MHIEDFKDTLSDLKVALVWPTLEALDDDIYNNRYNCGVHIYNNQNDIKAELEETLGGALEFYDAEDLAGDMFVELVEIVPTNDFGTATVQELRKVIDKDIDKFIAEYDQRFKGNKIYRYYTQPKAKPILES